MYVCQSVIWLTFLLKLHKYRDISSSGWDVFLKFFGDIPGMLVDWFQKILNILYVCQSIGWLTSLLKLGYYRDISSSGWDIWIHSWDIPTIVPNIFKFFVCLSVCSLLYFLAKIQLTLDISSSGRAIFLKFSGDIPLVRK